MKLACHIFLLRFRSLNLGVLINFNRCADRMCCPHVRTTDIGGYGGGNIDSPSFRQLIVRWFQWGAFCPLFRNHGARNHGPSQEGGNPECGGTGGSNEIWNFGNESEQAIAKVMHIREQLRPYVMEQWQAAADFGTPVMRPLFFDFWKDAGSQFVDDEMMFGPDYLVAPQLMENATSRSVYLPPLPSTYVWQNFFTNAEHNTSHGGVNITEETPLDTFPLYYRLQKTVYPPQPKPPKCDDTCTMVPHSDSGGPGGREIAHTNHSASFAECCGLCKANKQCSAFVWGPFDVTKPESAENPLSCFQLTTVSELKRVEERSFGCVR